MARYSVNWPNLIKFLSGVAAVAGIVFSIYSYLDTRSLEAKRPLLEAQFELYEEAVGVAARLSTVECGSDDVECILSYKEDCLRFRSLYWGELAVVEDTQVERAMMSFRKKFSAKHPQLCAPDQIHQIATMLKPHDRSDPDSLPLASLELAHCINASLHNSWNVELLPDRCEFPPKPSWFSRLIGPSDTDKR